MAINLALYQTLRLPSFSPVNAFYFHIRSTNTIHFKSTFRLEKLQQQQKADKFYL